MTPVANAPARQIAILGAGREGRSVLHWLRAREPSAKLTVIAEQPPEAAFRSSLRTGEHLLVEPLTAGRLAQFDLVVRSPGISPWREPLQSARGQGTVFTTATNLWFEAHPGARTICITGTKGKSTTSALTAHLLRERGLRVQLAGNIGEPLLACKDSGCDWWVVELSSYQIADLEACPDIAVLLNLSPEHLDWHGGVQQYFADKLRLAERVKPGGLVINGEDPELANRFRGRSDVTWFGTPTGIHLRADGLTDAGETLPVRMPADLPGRHNRMNVAAALTVLKLVGADHRAAARAVAAFSGLSHRLQLLGERGGITYVNDSIASAPVATSVALEALSGRSVVVLLGGYDRGVDWSPYVPEFLRNPPHAVLGLPDNGERVLECLRSAGLVLPGGLQMTSGLEDALQRAQSIALPGFVVLLSPGAPSFPRFKDYRERGQVFARLAGFQPIVE